MHRRESRIVRPSGGKGSGANPLLGCLVLLLLLLCLIAGLLMLAGEDLFFWWVWLS